MNKLKYLFSTILFMSMIMVGCSDDVEYNVGPLPEGQSSYFAPGQKSKYSVNTETATIEIPVYRFESAGANQISINSEMDDASSAVLTVPSTLSFDAGSDVATLAIKMANPTSRETYTAKIMLGENTPYAESTITIEVFYKDPSDVDPEKWTVVSNNALFVENMFGPFGVSDNRITDIVVEKLDGGNKYRFRSPYNNDYFQSIYGETLFPADFEAPYIIIDGDIYSEEGDNLWYIKPTALGFKMVNGAGPHYDNGWNTFGSIAGNLQTSEGVIPPNSSKYPLGKWDAKTKTLDLGFCYHNIGEYGFFVQESGSYRLHLDPSLLGLDYAKDYTWKSLPLEGNIFTSQLLRNPWLQTIQVAKEDPNIYALPNLFNESKAFYFGYNSKQNKFNLLPELDFQPSGLKLGENELYMKMDIQTSTYDRATKTFSLSIDYYTLTPSGNNGDVYTLMFRTIETLVEGTNPYDELKENIAIDDYLGAWSVSAINFNNGSSLTIPISITKSAAGNSLEVRGLSLLPELGEDYDDVVELSFDAETGLIVYEEQQVTPYRGYATLAMIIDSGRGNLTSSEDEVFVGGINKAGQVYLFNGENNDNPYDGISYMYINNNRYNFVTGYFTSLLWTPAAQGQVASIPSFTLAPYKAFEKKVNTIVAQPIVNGPTYAIGGKKMINTVIDNNGLSNFKMVSE